MATTLFSERPDYADLTPIQQQDPPDALVPINYSTEYRDAMDIFRALVYAQERSERALEVTSVLIRLNPGHYSVWAYRAQTLLALKSDLNTELEMMDDLVREFVKSYQVWQHRRTIVTELNDSSREIAFTKRALEVDDKNYHTWAYRQWVLCHFFSRPSDSGNHVEGSTSSEQWEEVWKHEIDYTSELIKDDTRNNSVWNHRFFALFESGWAMSKDEAEKKKVVERELSYTQGELLSVPNNPSAWNYLRGILTKADRPFSALDSFVAPLCSTPAPVASLEANQRAETGLSDKLQLPSILAIEFAADSAIQKQEKPKAKELFQSLIELDPIRTKYWQFRVAECA